MRVDSGKDPGFIHRLRIAATCTFPRGLDWSSARPEQHRGTYLTRKCEWRPATRRSAPHQETDPYQMARIRLGQSAAGTLVCMVPDQGQKRTVDEELDGNELRSSLKDPFICRSWSDWTRCRFYRSPIPPLQLKRDLPLTNL